jgi:hypothetical protein
MDRLRLEAVVQAEMVTAVVELLLLQLESKETRHSPHFFFSGRTTGQNRNPEQREPVRRFYS